MARALDPAEVDPAQVAGGGGVGQPKRVGWRVGLIPAKTSANDAHELYLAMLEPDQMYEAHVNLITHGRQICHARNPECSRCPLVVRCRYVDRKAP